MSAFDPKRTLALSERVAIVCRPTFGGQRPSEGCGKSNPSTAAALGARGPLAYHICKSQVRCGLQRKLDVTDKRGACCYLNDSTVQGIRCCRSDRGCLMKHVVSAWRALFASAALLVSVSANAQTTIDTTPLENGLIGSFGSPGNAATIGQTFTAGAGDTILSNFSLFLTGATTAGSLDFRGYIATWNGLNSTAMTLLYSSSTVTMTGSGTRTEFTFSPDIAIQPFQQYVAFLSTSALFPQAGSPSFPMPTAQDSLAGSVVFLDNHSDFGALFLSSWYTYVAPTDVSFRANFNVALGDPDSVISGVPEPTTWAMMIVGFGLVGWNMRRSRSRRTALAAV